MSLIRSVEKTGENKEQTSSAPTAVIGAAQERLGGSGSNSSSEKDSDSDSHHADAVIAPEEEPHEVGHLFRGISQSFADEEPKGADSQKTKVGPQKGDDSEGAHRLGGKLSGDENAQDLIAESNKRVADLVNGNKNKSPEGYKELATKLKGMDQDQLVIALAELPAEEAKKVSDAFQAQLPVAGPISVDVMKENLLKSQKMAIDKINRLREANLQIGKDDLQQEQSGQSGGSDAILNQIENNPDIANLIALANPNTLDDVVASLQGSSPPVEHTVSNLAKMSQYLDDGLVQGLAKDVLPQLSDGKCPASIPENYKKLFDVSKLPPQLGLELTKQLASTNESLRSQANGLLASSSETLATKVAENARVVQDENQQLAELTAQWQGVMTPDELQGAIVSYKARHKEYAELEAQGSALVAATDAMLKMPEELKAGLNPSLQKMEQQLVPALENTASAKMEVGKLLGMPEDVDNPGLLDNVDFLVSTGAVEGPKFVDAMRAAAFSSTSAKLTAAFTSGDTARVTSYFDDLARRGNALGLPPGDMRHLERSFNKLQAATASGNASDIAAARADFETRSRGIGDKLGSPSSPGRMNFHGLLGIAGAIGCYNSYEQMMSADTWDEKTQAFLSSVTGAGTTVESVAQIRSYLSWSRGAAAVTGGPAEAAFLKPWGRVMAGTGALVAGWQAASAFKEGDFAAGGFSMLEAAGSVAMAAGATGFGAAAVVIGVGGNLALSQYRHLQYSNHLEDGDTEAFLHGGGVPERALHHLRNADGNGPGDGMSVGPVLEALAKHLEIPPHMMLHWASSLGQDELLNFVEKMHGVEPNEDGSYNEDTCKGDKSNTVEGLERWLKANGYQLPVPDERDGWN